jgi:hypothetical protein
VRRSLWLVLYSENCVGDEMRGGTEWAGRVAGVAESEMPSKTPEEECETWA